MRTRADIECWLTDMDGVLVHENTPDSRGRRAAAAVARRRARPFLVLTNNSIFTPRDLSARLRASGLVVPEERDLDVGARDGRLPAQPGARRHARS